MAEFGTPATAEREGSLMALIEDELSVKAAVDSDVAQAQTEVDSALARFNQALAQLSIAKNRLRVRQDHSHRLLRSITEKRLELSPVLRIPTDILHEVFIAWSDDLWGCIEKNIEQDWWKGGWPATPIPVATRVCKAWNDVIVQCPRVWARLPIHPVHPEFDLEGVRRWLKLSQSMPLSVFINAKDLEEQMMTRLDDIFTSILPHIHRLRSVEVFYDIRTREQVMAFFQAPLPTLLHLSLEQGLENFSEDDQSPLVVPPNFLCSLPQLTHCYLVGTPLPRVLPAQLRCLTFLSLTKQSTDAITTRGIEQIQHCIHLETLSLAWYTEPIPPTTAAWRCPPSVRRLTCNHVSLQEADLSPLGTVSPPLDTYCIYDSPARHCAEQLKRLQDVGVQLKELTIHSCDIINSLQLGFAHHPTITSLSLIHTNPFPLDSLFAGPSMLLPRLKQFEIICCPSVTGDEVIQVLQTRRGSEVPVGVSQLGTLRVDRCDKVTPWHRHIIKELLKLGGRD